MTGPTRSLTVALLCLAVGAMAGDLEPNAPPGPTMKSLNEIPPTWSQRLAADNGSTNPLTLGCGSSRFECIWWEGSPISLPSAVLDRETGLVWERSPEYPDEPWDLAVSLCHVLEKGDRLGWRLPTVEELASLIDPTQSAPALPDGHPFLNIHSGSQETYWTQTIHAGATGSWWFASFEDAELNVSSSGLRYVWCVRGGHGSNAY